MSFGFERLINRVRIGTTPWFAPVPLARAGAANGNRADEALAMTWRPNHTAEVHRKNPVVGVAGGKL